MSEGKPVKRYSLARRLILAVLLVELASAVALIAAASVYEATTHFHAMDIMLRGRAAAVLGSVQDAEDKQDSVMLDGSEAQLPKNDIYLVIDDRGRTVGRSAKWPNAERMVVADGDKRVRSLTVDDRTYRVLREAGTRVIDSADKGGGVRRNVVIFYGSPTHPVWEQVTRAVAFYAAASLVLLLVTGIVMFRLLRHGLEPLSELAGQAARVSVRDWHFAPSARARAVGELAPLIDALETALAGLEQSFGQQARFVGDAAHELKTSVAVIKSSLQLLTMRQRTADEYAAGLDRVQADCERLEELVASMLTLARVEAAFVPDGSHAAQAELGEIARDVANQYLPLAEIADVGLAVESPGAVWVAAERDQVRLLCSNLVHNALQHSSPGGTIRLHVVCDAPARGELAVTDQGTGIPPEALPHIFERFYRSDPSRSRRTGGTGLGLAISKAIAVRFHGDLELSSEYGHGTRATVRLPLAAAGRAAGENAAGDGL